MAQDIDIKGVPFRSEDVYLFKSSLSFLNGYTMECSMPHEARGSALFEKLFELPWVAHVVAEGRALIVRKKPRSGDWKKLSPMVARIVRKLHNENVPFFSEHYMMMAAEKKAKLEESNVSHRINHQNVETPMGRQIQQLLDQHVSQSLALHGGKVTMVDLKDGLAYLNFGGGCQGCSQITSTVKDGVEKLLIKDVEGLKGVVDVTDHTAGKNPYYKMT